MLRVKCLFSPLLSNRPIHVVLVSCLRASHQAALATALNATQGSRDDDPPLLHSPSPHQPTRKAKDAR